MDSRLFPGRHLALFDHLLYTSTMSRLAMNRSRSTSRSDSLYWTSGTRSRSLSSTAGAGFGCLAARSSLSFAKRSANVAPAGRASVTNTRPRLVAVRQCNHWIERHHLAHRRGHVHEEGWVLTLLVASQR